MASQHNMTAPKYFKLQSASYHPADIVLCKCRVACTKIARARAGTRSMGGVEGGGGSPKATYQPSGAAAKTGKACLLKFFG